MPEKVDGKVDPTKTARWIVGIAGTWIILSFLVDLDQTRELGAGLALVILGSVALTYGPEAIQRLGFAGSI